MSETRIVDPDLEPVEPEEVMAEARLEDATELDLIRGYITAARMFVEEYLHKSLLAQTWQVNLDAFPTTGGPLRLRHGPLLRRTDISPVVDPVVLTYTNEAGAVTLLSGFQFAEFADPPVVYPVYGEPWPVARLGTGAIALTYSAGYGVLPADVPKPIRLAITRLAALWYDVRLPVAVGAAKVAVELPFMVTALLQPYRTMWHA